MNERIVLILCLLGKNILHVVFIFFEKVKEFYNDSPKGKNIFDFFFLIFNMWAQEK